MLICAGAASSGPAHPRYRGAMEQPNQTLTALAGVRVGHWTDLDAATGCTVIVLPAGGVVASGEVRGGAPGTRETALLEPTRAAPVIHAICLAGGSAYGLAAADGVMAYLEAAGEGILTPFGRVPIVPSAVIYDLGTGRADLRPTKANGHAAALAATSDPVASGRIGAAAGAKVGKYLGFINGEPGGLGHALVQVGGARVVALAVVNAACDIVDEAGQVLAGARHPDGQRPSQAERLAALAAPEIDFLQGNNTTLLVVGSDAPLSKTEAKVLAEAAHLGQAARPSHTPHDGDSSFVFSVGGGPPVVLMALVAAVQQAVAQAVRNAVSRG
jgi:L-aminopeptidase/D-esterase-like protein